VPVELAIAPEAELDIAGAYVWYEGRRAGLGPAASRGLALGLGKQYTIDKWRVNNAEERRETQRDPTSR
jgi:hypothetical protein